MRQLVTIREISRLDPIEGADAIECATVDGWTVVVKKNEFSVGEQVVFFEVDSWVPQTVAPFLVKSTTAREYNGVPGERLKSIRLRGQLSQGLVLPLTIFGENGVPEPGSDLAAELGVQKWERPIPACLQGKVRNGLFIPGVPKTDQERVQNLGRTLERFIADGHPGYEVTEKLDGTSCTFARVNGEARVASRNLDLLEDDTNTYWQMARELNIHERMAEAGYDNLAIQGEIIGPNIQGNKYELRKPQFHMFNAYDIAAGRKLTPQEKFTVQADLKLAGCPVIDFRFDLTPEVTVQYLLAKAGGESRLKSGVLREGLVFEAWDGSDSFKAVSNEWLLKYKE